MSNKLIPVPTELIFDLDIEDSVNNLLKMAIKEYPNRSWTMEVIFWDDGDYAIELSTSWVGKHQIFKYEKDKNKYSSYTATGGERSGQIVENFKELEAAEK